jgi:predicted dithiol-disulfide oxidoreductase (DUF899 family)
VARHCGERHRQRCCEVGYPSVALPERYQQGTSRRVCQRGVREIEDLIFNNLVDHMGPVHYYTSELNNWCSRQGTHRCSATERRQTVDQNEILSHDDWTKARKALLVEEKEFLRLREELARRRRALPWEAVRKEYLFEGATGERTLVDLFDGCSQLVVYHFMFDPASDEGCPHCSFWADNFQGAPMHLKARHVSFVAISRAPFAKIAAYKARMGWTFPWLSSFGSEFNYDFGVSFTPRELAEHAAVYNYGSSDPGLEDREGISVFCRDDRGEVFHTYSTYARGIDMVNGTYQFLDLTPKGRDEPGDFPQFWVRRHDEYDA